MLVKICGISNAIDAFVAIESGADAIGLVMGGKVLPPEVEPHAQHVRQFIKKFPKEVDSFLVTHLMSAVEILALANYINCTGIQVSEDVGVEVMKELRSKTDKKIIKTVVVNNEKESLDKLAVYEPYCDFILLDTRHGGYTGGTGVTNDWNLCAKIIKKSKKPVYIAGGLTPDNLLSALQETNPQGADVSTGVGTYSDEYLRKDRKDADKIKQFIEIAKNYKYGK
jgi:phosphoribosylanthranilate isomerase